MLFMFYSFIRFFRSVLWYIMWLDQESVFAEIDMEKLVFITLRENPALKDTAAEWFHSKWSVPKEAYLECMESYLKNETEYGWYLCLDGNKIVGGFFVWSRETENRKCPGCISIDRSELAAESCMQPDSQMVLALARDEC